MAQFSLDSVIRPFPNSVSWLDFPNSSGNVTVSVRSAIKQCLNHLHMKSTEDVSMYCGWMLRNFPASFIIQSMDDMLDVASNYFFGVDSTSYLMIADVFRHPLDHPLALYVDLAAFHRNNAFLQFLLILEVPIPHTAKVLTEGTNSIDPAIAFLIKLIVSKEDTGKCLYWIDAHFSSLDVAMALNTAAENDDITLTPLFSCYSGFEVRSIVADVNDRHGGFGNVTRRSASRLGQLAVYHECHKVLDWLNRQQLFPQVFDSATDCSPSTGPRSTCTRGITALGPTP